MKNKSIAYYKESGIAPPINLLACFLTSTLIIIPVSYFFSLIITYMPFIYLNMVLVILFGYSISLIVNSISKLFKIRNRNKKVGLTLIVTLFGFYANWVSYFYLITTEKVTLFFDISTYINYYLRPDLIVLNILELSKFGTWEIFSITFKDSALWIVWIAEFLIIILTSYYGIIKAKEIPFSENDNKWYKKHTIDTDFEPIKFRNDFIDKYSENPFEAICSLGKSDFTRFSKIYVYSSDSETRNLISIDNVLISEGGKGKKEYDEILAPNYIDSNYMIQLRQKFKLKKSSFFDFFNDLYS